MDNERAAPHPLLDDPELTLALVMQAWPETIAVFVRHRMHCVGCPVRRFHTIEDACRIYDTARVDFLDELGQAITLAKVPR